MCIPWGALPGVLLSPRERGDQSKSRNRTRDTFQNRPIMTCIYNIHIYYICNIHIIYVGQRGLAKSGLTMAHPTILYDASLFLLYTFFRLKPAALPHT